jgi:exopolysaccharide biosynthesis polyprenyl glycosylphosphotransferase
LFLPLDLVLILAADLLAWHLRFGVWPSNAQFMDLWPFTVLVRIIYLYAKGFYRGSFSSLSELFFRSLANVTFSSVIIIAATFLNRHLNFSRLVLAYSWALTFLFIFLVRVPYLVRSARMQRNRKFVLLGDSNSVRRVLAEVAGARSFPGRVTAVCADKPVPLGDRSLWKGSLTGFLGRPRDFGADAFVLAMDGLSEKRKMEIVGALSRMNFRYYVIPTFYELITGRADRDFVSDYAFVEPLVHPIRTEERFVKRLFDIVFSSVVLVCFIPIGLVIGLLIFLTMGPPVIYKQNRVGRHGRPFRIYKFRTMVKDADRIGPVLTRRNDSRVTALGKFLRRTSLDEFPQFLNVIKGDMSVVGPRPEVPEIVRTYTPIQREVLRVRPGLTGLPQISGRQDLPLEVKLKMDLNYVRNYSLLQDLRIIVRTAFSFLHTRGAF